VRVLTPGAYRYALYPALSAPGEGTSRAAALALGVMGKKWLNSRACHALVIPPWYGRALKQYWFRLARARKLLDSETIA